MVGQVDSVNNLIDDLVQPTREIARVIGAVAKGDLSQSMAMEREGPRSRASSCGRQTVNTMVDQLGAFASEVNRVAPEVGAEGKLAGRQKSRASLGRGRTSPTASTAWRAISPARSEHRRGHTAVANGDLSKKITVDVKGEILQLKDTINTMVDQLGSFASEVTRVAPRGGLGGKLGGQAVVRGVAGGGKT